MSDIPQCASDDHVWCVLPRTAFTSANVLIEGGLHEIPIAEVFLPTHRCHRCGVAATIVIHDRPDAGQTQY